MSERTQTSNRINSRRVLLALSGVVIASIAFSAAPKKAAEPSTPDEAIAELVAGNARYVENMNKAHTIDVPRADLDTIHAPFAAIIRCADARVAPEITFDQQLGRLFVCAVAGNISTPEIVASLEYSVAVLGAKAIVVLGHSNCGAVVETIKNRADTTKLPGSLPMLADQILSPCCMTADPNSAKDLDAAIACNANKGAVDLVRRSPVLADAVKSGKLKIIAGVQNLKSGKFEITSK